jgi:tRNA A-37 threonylcarbamoyl transferase component Bud32
VTDYLRIRQIGRGGSAEVWLARDDAGREVALKHVTAGPTVAATVADAARAAAALGHPNVLGLVAVRGDTLVLPYVPGGSLAAALTAGARYAAPQAAALGAALAGALAAAHAAGLVHGDVKPANVLLAGPGVPLLADFRGTGAPEDDVRALAALCATLDPALAPVLAGATTAAGLRDALLSYDPATDGDDPEPTRDFGPRPPAPAPVEPATRHRPRPVLPALPAGARIAAVAAAVLAVAVLAGSALPRTSSAGSLPAPQAPDWRATLAALDAARSAAFARSDAGALDAVYVPGAAPLAADRALLVRYARAGRHVSDLHMVAVSVAPGPPAAAPADQAQVVLAVADRLLPYTVVDAAGRPVARYAGRGVRRWLITLRHDAGGWRIAAVARVTAEPS